MPKDSVSWRDLFQPQGSACQGATHLVRGATVGAFVLALSEQKTTGVGVGVVGVTGQDSRVVLNQQGDTKACASVSDSLHAPVPPPQCGAPIRLVLIPIEGKPWPDAVDPPACPPGRYENTDGVCSPPRPGVPHTCRFSEPADCLEQCRLRSPSSCNSLGVHYEFGWASGRDERLAMQLYTAACGANHAKACTNRARLVLKVSDPRSPDGLAAVQLLNRTCHGDDTRACTELAKYETIDTAVVTAAASLVPGLRPRLGPTRGELLQRGCRGGDAAACAQLAAAPK
jgi:hypothetical protein